MNNYVTTGFEPVAAQLASTGGGRSDLQRTGLRFPPRPTGRRCLHRSRPRDEDLMCVYSSSKGAVAVCVALLVDDQHLDLDDRVARYWPEFAAEGKGDITVRVALSHQAGLVGLSGGYTVDELVAHTPIAERLAAMHPLWRPGSAHGYHGITIGTLVDELIRRITGTTFRDFYARRVRAALGIDLYFGIGEARPAANRVVQSNRQSCRRDRSGELQPQPDSCSRSR